MLARGLQTLLLLVAALLLHTAGVSAFRKRAFFDPFSNQTQADKKLLEWIEEKGGSSKVAIGYNKEGIRGVYTTQAVRQGETLFFVPDKCLLRTAQAARLLVHQLYDKSSEWAPYFQALPGQEEITNGFNIPEDYFSFIASDAMQDRIEYSYLPRAEQFCEQADEQLKRLKWIGPGGVETQGAFPQEHCSHVAALLSSRIFKLADHKTMAMVPLLDLVRHGPAVHALHNHGEPPGMRLIAGRSMKAREEVYVHYGNATLDEFFLAYGLADHTQDPPRFCVSDRRTYRPGDVSTAAEVPAREARPSTNDRQSLVVRPNPELIAWQPANAAEAADEIRRLNGLVTAIDEAVSLASHVPNRRPGLKDQILMLHKLRRRALMTRIKEMQQIHKELSDAASCNEKEMKWMEMDEL